MRWLSTAPMRWVICAGCLSVFLLPPAQSQTIKLHTGRQRRIKWFHFEERDVHQNKLPRHWFAIGRKALTSNPNFGRYDVHKQLMSMPGFPRYTTVQLDTAQHASGKESLYLGLNGGSAGAFLEVGAVGAVQNSDYMITSRLLTKNLKRSHARLVAYFIDRDGKQIKQSIASSPLIQTDGSWQPVSVKLLGDFPEAAWIGISVQLLQPKFNVSNPLGNDQVVFGEVRGGAWFDDITVWQLPRLVVRTQSRVNILRPPVKPELAMQVVDLTGKPLSVEVTVYDYEMNAIDKMIHDIGPGKPPTWRWMPRLARFGWYLVDMIVYENKSRPSPDDLMASSSAADPSGQRKPVARTISSLLWLPEASVGSSVDAKRFGIVAEDLSEPEMNLLPKLMDDIALNAVTLSVWNRNMTLEQLDLRQQLLDNVLHDLLSKPRQITMSLFPLPDELARAVDISPNSPMGLFGKPVKKWSSFLQPVLMRHGQRVNRWQLGSADYSEPYYNSRLPEMLEQVNQLLRTMAPDPIVVVPWSIEHQLGHGDHGRVAYSIRVPSSILPEHLSTYLANWSSFSTLDKTVPGLAGQGGLSDSEHTHSSMDSHYHLLLDVPVASEMSHVRRVNDVALNMLYGWEAGAEGFHLRKPWALSHDREKQILPDAILGAFSSIANQFLGRRVVGRLPLGQGLVCMIFDGPAGGMLAVWNESADDDLAKIDLYLGKDPVAIDIWGNRTPVEQVDGKHQLQLTQTPVFIEGIDPDLALFRASFRLLPAFIESRQIVHQRQVTLKNPWPRTISGYMVITHPDQWKIRPRRTYFSIAPGNATTIALALRFPHSEVAGHKKLQGRFEFNATQRYNVDMSTAMELGLKDVEMDTDLSLETNAQTGQTDAIVNMLITNKGTKVLTLRAFANMPDQPRESRTISGLKPGESIIRRIRFEDVGMLHQGKRIRVGLRELAGPAVLNHVLVLDR